MRQNDEPGLIRAKEPWLAVAVSWLCPGLGHLYIRQKTKGICLLVTAVALQFTALWSLLVANCEPYVFFLLVIAYLPFTVFASLDAYRKARGPRTGRAEKAKRGPKNPWLAVFLSLIIPGAGHLYLRRYVLFVVYILACFLLGIIGPAIFHTPGITLLLRTALGSFAVGHAYYLAIHAPGQKSSSNDTRWLIAVLLAPPCVGIITVAVVTFVIQAFSLGLDGCCMEPVLTTRDRILVNKMSYVHESPQPGDIIAFNLPEAYGEWAGTTGIKRIAAIAGETIQNVDGKFVVIDVDGNRRTLTQPYAGPWPASSWLPKANMQQPPATFGVTEPYTVPPDSYFLLGDNLDNSYDSRHIGPVWRGLIVGKVTKIFWPPSRARVLAGP